MGFISNQWLNSGKGLRSRSYSPVPVSVSCRASKSSWSNRNQVPITFTARQSNRKYQTLYLTHAEAEVALGALVTTLSVQNREKLIVSLLRELSHAELLSALALDLNVRVCLPKNP